MLKKISAMKARQKFGPESCNGSGLVQRNSKLPYIRTGKIIRLTLGDLVDMEKFQHTVRRPRRRTAGAAKVLGEDEGSRQSRDGDS